MEDLIKQLNDLKITQTSEWEEDLPEEIWKQYFENNKPVAEGLEVDKRRWYETSITVYKLGEEFMGVRSVTDTFSETMSISDVDYTLEFFEMEEVKVISYQRK